MRVHFALPILAALSFASPVLAEAPANTIMKVTPPKPGEAKPSAGGQEDPGVFCAHKYRTQAYALTQLGAMLKLTAAQKPIFADWRKTRLEMFQLVPCPEPSMGLDVPAPKRIENQITIVSATLDGLRKELPATRTLYDALTPEQRAIFDGPIKMNMSAPPPAAPPPTPAH